MESSAYNKQSEPPKKTFGGSLQHAMRTILPPKKRQYSAAGVLHGFGYRQEQPGCGSKGLRAKSKAFRRKEKADDVDGEELPALQGYRHRRRHPAPGHQRYFQNQCCGLQYRKHGVIHPAESDPDIIKRRQDQVSALRDQASNLENYKNDQGNASQWALLTGKNMDNCKPDPNVRPSKDRDACKDADKVYHELIAIPKKCLVFDVDYLVKSAADIVGIQTFSNIAALTVLQSNLSDAGKAFITSIQAAAKARAADLVTVQADLITTVTDTTVSGINKFTAISDCDAAYATLEFLCKPDCHCVERRDGDECQPRLHKCECEICEICSEVKNTYCEAGKEKPVIS